MDRGPYGKHDADGVWFNSATDRKKAEKEGREPKKGVYKGIIDMGPSVAKQLNSKGRIKVKVRWWRDNPLAPTLDEHLLQ